jgi:Ca-activated chloride channel family protein
MRQAVLLVLVGMMFISSYIFSDNLSRDNMVILMDCSGSMQGEKLDQAKTALKEVLKQVPPNTNVGLLTFGAKKGWVYNLGERNDARLLKAIDSLSAQGNTPLGTYMKIASDKLLMQRKKQMGYGTYRLLVITDGEANDESPELVDAYTTDIIRKGITIDAIGVFMDSDHTLATKVHSYRRANDEESLKKAISEILAEVAVNSDGTISKDAFELISGLSTEEARIILKALPDVDNSPIIKAKPDKDYSVDQKQAGKKKKFSFFNYLIIFIIIMIALRILANARRRRVD